VYKKEVKDMITDIIVKDASHKGKGVFALRDFTRGDFLFRRRHGKVIANRETPLLSEEDQRHLCELAWETSAILLAPGCYLNHSCEDIREGEEITIDYRLNAFTGERWDCSCGSANCQGYVIGSFFSLTEDQQRLYLTYVPKFIRDEYHRRHA
jgi:hypothetical protein